MFEQYLTKTGRLSPKQPQEIKNAWYIQKFVEVHGTRYDYSRVEYCGAKEKVVITCPIHGGFPQTPNDHLNGSGCPRCAGNSKKTTEECKQDFLLVHGAVYDYSAVEYLNDATKVEITCQQHGSFFQKPNDHLQGKGCPKCSGHNQDTLYILKCLSASTYKIGITNNLTRRISSIGGSLEYIFHIKTENPRNLEKQLHDRYKDYNVFNPTVRSGSTEFFNLTSEQVADIVRYLEGL